MLVRIGVCWASTHRSYRSDTHARTSRAARTASQMIPPAWGRRVCGGTQAWGTKHCVCTPRQGTLSTRRERALHAPMHATYAEPCQVALLLLAQAALHHHLNEAFGVLMVRLCLPACWGCDRPPAFTCAHAWPSSALIKASSVDGGHCSLLAIAAGSDMQRVRSGNWSTTKACKFELKVRITQGPGPCTHSSLARIACGCTLATISYLRRRGIASVY